MTIDILSPSTVKIRLTPNDLAYFNINEPGDLCTDTPSTRRFLCKLIEQVRSEKQVDFTAEHLCVEVFPHINGSCLLYLSSLDSQEKRKSRELQVCQFPKAEALLDFAIWLEDRPQKSISGLQSQLYCRDGAYRLVLERETPLAPYILGGLREFGTLLEKPRITAAATREHWKILVAKEAVERLFTITAL